MVNNVFLANDVARHSSQKVEPMSGGKSSFESMFLANRLLMLIPVKSGHRSAPNQATCPAKSATLSGSGRGGAGMVII